MRRILRRPAARIDVIEIAGFYADGDEEVAVRFLDAVESTYHFLNRTPAVGAPRGYLNARLEGLRMWPVKGFKKCLIFYRLAPEGLEIIRVLHCARDIEALFRDED